MCTSNGHLQLDANFVEINFDSSVVLNNKQPLALLFVIDGHGSMLLAGARSVGHIIILITEGQVLKEGLLQAVAQNLKKI